MQRTGVIAMIELDRVVKIYDGKSRVVALDEVSLLVERGEMVAVMGQSGSGKSTLLNIIGGLDRPTSGSVRIDGIALEGLGDDGLTCLRREKIGFVFQFFNLLPTLSAFDNVALPQRLRRCPPAEVEARTSEMLALVGLEPRSNHLPDELSGGECQRVAIARALVMNPKVVLADEPTGNLDSKTNAEILDLLQRLNRELSSTLVMVTHDATAAAHCHRILRLRDGRLAGDEPVAALGREVARG
jgi:putative ABC transport system ATP-binding protein